MRALRDFVQSNSCASRCTILYGRSTYLLVLEWPVILIENLLNPALFSDKICVQFKGPIFCQAARQPGRQGGSST